jgi:hypothetical protein
MFPGASDIAFSRGTIWVEAESGAAWADFFMNNFGPLVIARGKLGDDTFGELRTKVIEGWEGANESTDGRLRFGQEYLLSVLRF